MSRSEQFMVGHHHARPYGPKRNNQLNIHSKPLLRNASKSDAAALARLIDLAGEGIPSWLWARTANDQRVPLEIGIERAMRPQGGFSYTNALVAEADNRIQGMVLSYPITKAPTDDPDDLPAPIAPFVELEKHSVGSWYVNALAVFPAAQNQGLGEALLLASEQQARQQGHTEMSIQVYSQNNGAVRLYARLGYTKVASASVRLHPCAPYYTGEVLLLKKPLAG